jgi:hypothetical protein
MPHISGEYYQLETLKASAFYRLGRRHNAKSNIKNEISKLLNPPKADDFLNFGFWILHFDFLIVDRRLCLLYSVFCFLYPGRP